LPPDGSRHLLLMLTLILMSANPDLYSKPNPRLNPTSNLTLHYIRVI